MTSVRRVHYTYAEYLALESASSTRHEYLDGEIYAMAGGTPDHAALAARVIGALVTQLRPECRAFTADLRIRIEETGLSTYPDAAVVRGPSERAASDGLAVVNPVVLIEVTSNSTEDYDRGEKLRQYQTLPSVQEIVFVSHRSQNLTRHRRERAGWTATEVGTGESVELTSVGVRLHVDDIYQGGLEDAAR